MNCLSPADVKSPVVVMSDVALTFDDDPLFCQAELCGKLAHSRAHYN